MKTINEPNQHVSQNTIQQVVRVTPNTNSNFQIPAVASDSSVSANPSSFGPKKQAGGSSFRYRPSSLNTNARGDIEHDHTKTSNVPSRRSTSNKNEPVYATVGSVNSNQRLVKNLKSANV